MEDDYVLDSQNVSYRVSDFPIEVTITIVNDEIAEINEKFEVFFNIQMSEGVIQGDNVVSVTIFDDDGEYICKLHIRYDVHACTYVHVCYAFSARNVKGRAQIVRLFCIKNVE